MQGSRIMERNSARYVRRRSRLARHMRTLHSRLTARNGEKKMLSSKNIRAQCKSVGRLSCSFLFSCFDCLHVGSRWCNWRGKCWKDRYQPYVYLFNVTHKLPESSPKRTAQTTATGRINFALLHRPGREQSYFAGVRDTWHQSDQPKNITGRSIWHWSFLTHTLPWSNGFICACCLRLSCRLVGECLFFGSPWIYMLHGEPGTRVTTAPWCDFCGIMKYEYYQALVLWSMSIIKH